MTERYWNADSSTLLDLVNDECIEAIEDMITSSDSMRFVALAVDDNNVGIYLRTCEITGKVDKDGEPLRFLSPTYDVFEIITKHAVELSAICKNGKATDEEKELLRDEVAALSNLSAKLDRLIQQISAKNNL